MSLKYEPDSEPLHIYVKWLFLDCELLCYRRGAVCPMVKPCQDHVGTSLIRNSPPPQDHHRALEIAILQGPGSALVFMGEVPL